jgi:hypothetical protein
MCADVDHSVVGLVEVLLLADGPACQLSQALLELLDFGAALANESFDLVHYHCVG